MNLAPKNLDPRISPILLLLLGAASFVIVIAGMQAASSLLNAFFLSPAQQLNLFKFSLSLSNSTLGSLRCQEESRRFTFLLLEFHS